MTMRSFRVQRWQYRSVYISWLSGGGVYRATQHPDEASRISTNPEAFLNQMGMEGWELCGVASLSLGGSEDGFVVDGVYTFKRTIMND